MVPFLLPVVLDFYRNPRRFPALRDPASPLPVGISELLSWVGSIEDYTHTQGVAQKLGASPNELQEAVRFFVKEALFRAEGDSYRTLGLEPDADIGQIKRHYRQLMSLFHPDRDTSGDNWETDYAPLINEAYNALKRSHRGQGSATAGSGGWGGTTRGPRVGVTPHAAAQSTAEPTVAQSLVTKTTATKSKTWKPPQPFSLTHWQSWLPLLRRRRIYVPAVAIVVILIWAGNQNDTGADYAAYEPSLAMTQPLPELRLPDASHTEASNEPNTVASQIKAAEDAEEQRQANLVKQRTYEQRANEQQQQAKEREQEQHQRRLIALQAAEAAEQATVAERAQQAEQQRLAQLQADQLRAEEQRKLEQQRQLELQRKAERDRQLAQQRAEKERAEQESARQQRLEQQRALEQVAQQQPADSSPSLLTNDQKVRALFSALAEAYEAEDAKAFAEYFTANAVTPDATGQDAIRTLYENFFSANSADEFRFLNLRWKRLTASNNQAAVAEPVNPNDYQVNAKVSIVTTARDGSGGLATQVAITFHVTPVDNRYAITRMEY